MEIQTLNKAANFAFYEGMNTETPNSILKAAKMIFALHRLKDNKPDRGRPVYFDIRTVEVEL